MVEYMPCTHQVIGSNPITSKQKITNLKSSTGSNKQLIATTV